MTWREKLREIQKIGKEIEDIQEFMEILQEELTINEMNKSRFAMVRQRVVTSLIGFYPNERSVQIRIPDKMIAEIHAKCITWVEELERRAEELTVGS